MKTRMLVALAVLTLAAMIPGAAQAACPGGQTVTLSNTNINSFSVTIVLCITNGGATISWESESNSSGLTLKSIDQFGWNTDANWTGTTNSTGTWGEDTSCTLATPCNAFDGFHPAGFWAGDAHRTMGNVTNHPAPFGTDTPLTFDFDASAGGTAGFYAVHIQYSNGCSAYVSNTTTVSTSDNLTCSTPVPEPGTMALFGSGLLGLAAVVRRRLSL